MNTSSNKYKDVTEYIRSTPKHIQKTLKQIRATVLECAPNATESIAYGMPAYKLNGKPLAYFATFKNHIGFYATPHAHEVFAKELAKYKQGKGSVQFPIHETVPLALIRRMVKFNAKSLKAT
jgi:uncharacterized protein YdhG (YjbR/CyaY superfamily)